MHRFLDVCLAVQQDRDLAASLHSHLPLPTPALGDDSESASAAEDDDEEQQLARAIAAERAAQEDLQ
jgi:hypothetical protein